MKKTLAAFLIVSLTALAGCGDKGTPGGPGATSPTNKDPMFGQKDNSFTLSTSSITLKQGEEKETSIGIKRGTNFDQDVTITFDNLPKGVTVTPAEPVIKHGDKEAKFKVQAKDDASLDDHMISVKGSPSKGPAATNEIKLTVKKK
jgi:predicted small lipoprotein YifL